MPAKNRVRDDFLEHTIGVRMYRYLRERRGAEAPDTVDDRRRAGPGSKEGTDVGQPPVVDLRGRERGCVCA